MHSGMHIFVKIDSLQVHVGPENKDPSKTLAGDDCGATTRPAPDKVPPSQHRSSATTSLPTRQTLVWPHADLHGSSTTAPTQQLASQRGTACLISLDVRQSEEGRR